MQNNPARRLPLTLLLTPEQPGSVASCDQYRSDARFLESNLSEQGTKSDRQPAKASASGPPNRLWCHSDQPDCEQAWTVWHPREASAAALIPIGAE